MFRDIDRVFFGGWLRGNVEVRWTTTKAMMLRLDFIESYGWTEFLQFHPNQCRIILNSTTIMRDCTRDYTPFKQMWQTALHEMW